jgi:hypothetical protein
MIAYLAASSEHGVSRSKHVEDYIKEKSHHMGRHVEAYLVHVALLG